VSPRDISADTAKSAAGGFEVLIIVAEPRGSTDE
jgi:hypothetical protein